jgi:nanoRNase/pAp phosphatase (c-di-AMP/oligoRNAs hydrolase)
MQLRWLGESLARVEVSEEGGGVARRRTARCRVFASPGLVTSVSIARAWPACCERGGTVKVSLRGKGDIDVNRIAARFGGGGHPNAAGCTVPGALSAVTRDVLAAVHEAMRGEPAARPGRP